MEVISNQQNSQLIFSTKRLEIRELKPSDKDHFIEVLSNPEIIKLIPQSKPPLKEVIARFHEFRKYKTNPLESERVIWGIYEAGKLDLIGLCGLLTNNENQREIAYRFRTPFWGKGYGTEVAKHTIDYCFNELYLTTLAADVWIENKGSVKILEKFFKPVSTFLNANDNCTDRRYLLTKQDWINQQII